MGERLQLSKLRSVRISLFTLAVLGVSLISSLGYSRPTSAEGFLDSTLGCLLTLYIPQRCRPLVATPAPAPVPSPTSAAEATPSSSGATSGPVAPPPTTAPAAPVEGVEYMTPPAFDRTEELKAVEKAPELPASVHQRSFSYEPMAYLAYVYGVKGASITSATPRAEVIESTSNGWHVLGVVWYWWLVSAASIAGFFAWFKRSNYKKNLSLVK